MSSTAAPTAPPPVDLVNVQIDGEWHQFPKGTRMIEACRQVGKLVPGSMKKEGQIGGMGEKKIKIPDEHLLYQVLRTCITLYA